MKLNEYKLQLYDLESDLTNKHSYKKKIDAIKEYLKYNSEIDSLENGLFKAIFSKIIVVNRNELIYCIETDKSVPVPEFQTKIKEYVNYPPFHIGEYIENPIKYTHPISNFEYP